MQGGAIHTELRIESRVAAGFDYDTIPPGYYDEVFRRWSGIQSKWHHLKFARIAREIQNCGRHLDVGCGPGTFTGVFGNGRRSVGIDVSEPQIAYAIEHYGSAERLFYSCSPRDLPAEMGLFDAATAVELIEHLSPEEVRQVLTHTIDRLRPGGKLVVTTPNFGSAWPAVEALLNKVGDVSYSFQHVNRLTRPRLLTVLRDLGLRDVRVESYLLFAPFAAAFGWRLADVVSRIERGRLDTRVGFLLIGMGTKPE